MDASEIAYRRGMQRAFLAVLTISVIGILLYLGMPHRTVEVCQYQVIAGQVYANNCVTP